MDRHLFLGSTPITIDPQDSIGSGGQAVVTKYGRQALKLWHQPDASTAAKLTWLLQHPLPLPANILQPQTAISDAAGNLVGYAMLLLPDDFRELAVLFNHKLRLKLNLELPEALAILDQTRHTLDQIHRHAVIGDLSGRNLAFTRQPQLDYWYDLDSWAIDRFPCPVWTEDFVDPLLVLQVQSGQPPQFSRESDRYSFAVCLFWSIFFSHPFQGDHPQVTTMLDRARQGLWLFDPTVTPRRLTPHPEIISDELLDYFDHTFTKSSRQPLPSVLLTHQAQQLKNCSSCHHWYDQSRPHCPHCVKPQFKPQLKLIQLHRLLQTAEPIIFARFQADHLLAVSRDATLFTFHRRSPTGQTESVALPPLDPQTKFDCLGIEHLVTAAPHQSQLQLWSLNHPFSPLLHTTTQSFALNRQLAFRATAYGLLRLAAHQLLLGNLRLGQLVDTPLPLIISPQQTWFWADPNRPLQAGFFQLFDQQHYWLIHRHARFELKLPQLQPGESLLDLNLRFSDQSLLIHRLTRLTGKRWLHTDIFDLHGQSLSSTFEPADPPLDQLHGLAYTHLKLFIPTDQGILARDLTTGSFTPLPKTARAVTAHDQLIHLGRETHFLVIHDQEIEYLILS